MRYFDVEAKVWKPLASLAPATKVTECSCAVLVGSKLFVGPGGNVSSMGWCIYCYDVEKMHGHSFQVQVNQSWNFVL